MKKKTVWGTGLLNNSSRGQGPLKEKFSGWGGGITSKTDTFIPIWLLALKVQISVDTTKENKETDENEQTTLQFALMFIIKITRNQ